VVADQNSKIFNMAKVDESTTGVDWNGPVLPGVVLFAAPSVTLTVLLYHLHLNLRKRSLEWVGKNADSKGANQRVVVRKDNTVWFTAHSDGFPGTYMILTPPHKDYDKTDWRGKLKQMKREGTI